MAGETNGRLCRCRHFHACYMVAGADGWTMQLVWRGLALGGAGNL